MSVLTAPLAWDWPMIAQLFGVMALSCLFSFGGANGPIIVVQDRLVDTGILDEPLLRVWMQESVRPEPQYGYRPGRWIAETEWPSRRIEPRTLYLNVGDAARRTARNIGTDDIVEPFVIETADAAATGQRAGRRIEPDLQAEPVDVAGQRLHVLALAIGINDCSAKRAVGQPG